jgi:hypothetical protein
MQLTHNSYDVNTNVLLTLHPGIRNIRTYVNTNSGITAKGTKVYCPKYETVWTVVPFTREYLRVNFAETKKLNFI